MQFFPNFIQILKENFQKHFLPFLIIFVISLPFWFFLFQVKNINLPTGYVIIDDIWFTFVQAILSVVVCWLFAIPAALGLISFYRRPLYTFLEFLYIMPLFLPPLVVAGGFINILDFFKLTPFGLAPLVFGHVFTYSGGAAVILSRLLMSKTSSYYEWALVHGVSYFKLLYSLFRFVLRKDLQLISLTIFCFCFTSLSLPLLLGGAQNQTLEVVIYNYLKQPHYWPIAFGLLSFEILFIFALSFFIYKPQSVLKKLKPLTYLNFKSGVALGLIPLIFIILGLLEGLLYIPVVMQLKGMVSAMGATIVLSLLVGGMTIGFLSLISICYFSVFLKKFLIGYATPSVVLTGFMFLILFNEWTYLSWVLGLSILFLPPLYRWAGESLLSSLENQIQVAQTLGASSVFIFKKIIWPQCKYLFCFLGGVAGFWAAGDFAYTMITSYGKLNLALVAQQLLGQYRMEQGLAVVWIVLLTGSFCFLLLRNLHFLFKNQNL